MYTGVLLSRKVCTEGMGMDIFPESCHASDHISHLDWEFSVHSKERKTFECGNHYNVSLITLHAKTESPVHVQPLTFSLFDVSFLTMQLLQANQV